jgi:predicted ATPase with chaperone activity
MERLMNEPMASQAQPASNVIQMPRPDSVSDLGIRRSFLEELALKILYLTGPLSIIDLAEHLRLSYRATDEVFRRIREGQLCEVTSVAKNVPHLAITGQGRARALELLSLNQYSGPAPVSLSSYIHQVKLQSVRHVAVHPPDIQRAFAHLVLDSKTLNQLGTALNSGTSIFLHGPTGSGKTTIAETLTKVFAADKVWIPYAVEVDGEVIAVYDPVIHKKVDDPTQEIGDRRWVLCQRPAVLVGGELTIEMLDLQFNSVAKFYEGPVQMKANNGVLIIDDFGRQRLRPEELLNRWVVPLDRHIDFLSLAGGKKIEMPFEMFVVFATNMAPTELVDAAFLRRIQTKIRVGNISASQFHEIFRRTAESGKLQYDRQVVDELIHVIQHSLEQPLRACQPRDIINQIYWAARYEGTPMRIDHQTIKRAAEAYFLPSPKEDEN